MKKKTAQVVEPPTTRPLPKQRHLVTPLTTPWLMRSSPNAASPYTVEASEAYTQNVVSSYLSGSTCAFKTINQFQLTKQATTMAAKNPKKAGGEP